MEKITFFPAPLTKDVISEASVVDGKLNSDDDSFITSSDLETVSSEHTGR